MEDKEIIALNNAVDFLNGATKEEQESFLYYLTFRFMPDQVLQPKIKNMNISDFKYDLPREFIKMEPSKIIS